MLLERDYKADVPRSPKRWAAGQMCLDVRMRSHQNKATLSILLADERDAETKRHRGFWAGRRDAEPAEWVICNLWGYLSCGLCRFFLHRGKKLVLAAQVRRLLGKSPERKLVAFLRVLQGEKLSEAASAGAQLFGQASPQGGRLPGTGLDHRLCNEIGERHV